MGWGSKRGEERFVNSEGTIEDDYRIEFVTDHFEIRPSSNPRRNQLCGLPRTWTCMDNWSWTNAYKNRYGFIAVDLAQDGKRTIKNQVAGLKRSQKKTDLMPDIFDKTFTKMFVLTL